MKRLRISGIMVIFLTLVVLIVWAGAQVLEVTGVVTGRDGTPRGPATIQLSGQQRYVAISNALGQFSLPGVLPGEYMVTVTQTGKMHKFSTRVTSDTLDIKVPW